MKPKMTEEDVKRLTGINFNEVKFDGKTVKCRLNSGTFKALNVFDVVLKINGREICKNKLTQDNYETEKECDAMMNTITRLIKGVIKMNKKWDVK